MQLGLEEAGVDIKASYPELHQYGLYIADTNRMDLIALLAETEEIQSAIYQSLLRNGAEKELYLTSRQITYLKKLIQLQITSREYKQYLANKSLLNMESMTGFLNKTIMDEKKYYERALFLNDELEEIVQSAEKFYALTHQRDMAINDNIMQVMNAKDQQSAALVVGGFHAESLKQLFKSKGVSYVSITPQVAHATNHNQYEKLLLQESAKTVFDFQNISKHLFSPTTTAMQIPRTAFRQDLLAALLGNSYLLIPELKTKAPRTELNVADKVPTPKEVSTASRMALNELALDVAQKGIFGFDEKIARDFFAAFLAEPELKERILRLPSILWSDYKIQEAANNPGLNGESKQLTIALANHTLGIEDLEINVSVLKTVDLVEFALRSIGRESAINFKEIGLTFGMLTKSLVYATSSREYRDAISALSKASTDFQRHIEYIKRIPNKGVDGFEESIATAVQSFAQALGLIDQWIAKLREDMQGNGPRGMLPDEPIIIEEDQPEFYTFAKIISQKAEDKALFSLTTLEEDLATSREFIRLLSADIATVEALFELAGRMDDIENISVLAKQLKSNQTPSSRNRKALLELAHAAIGRSARMAASAVDVEAEIRRRVETLLNIRANDADAEYERENIEGEIIAVGVEVVPAILKVLGEIESGQAWYQNKAKSSLIFALWQISLNSPIPADMANASMEALVSIWRELDQSSKGSFDVVVNIVYAIDGLAEYSHGDSLKASMELLGDVIFEYTDHDDMLKSALDMMIKTYSKVVGYIWDYNDVDPTSHAAAMDEIQNSSIIKRHTSLLPLTLAAVINRVWHVDNETLWLHELAEMHDPVNGRNYKVWIPWIEFMLTQSASLQANDFISIRIRHDVYKIWWGWGIYDRDALNDNPAIIQVAAEQIIESMRLEKSGDRPHTEFVFTDDQGELVDMYRDSGYALGNLGIHALEPVLKALESISINSHADLRMKIQLASVAEVLMAVNNWDPDKSTEYYLQLIASLSHINGHGELANLARKELAKVLDSQITLTVSDEAKGIALTEILKHITTLTGKTSHSQHAVEMLARATENISRDQVRLLKKALVDNKDNPQALQNVGIAIAKIIRHEHIVDIKWIKPSQMKIADLPYEIIVALLNQIHESVRDLDSDTINTYLKPLFNLFTGNQSKRPAPAILIEFVKIASSLDNGPWSSKLKEFIEERVQISEFYDAVDLSRAPPKDVVVIDSYQNSFQKLSQKDPQMYNLLTHPDNAQPLLELLSRIRTLYYDHQNISSSFESPLQDAINKKLYYALGEGLYVTLLTDSFRRHIIFRMSDDGKVEHSIEIKIFGDERHFVSKEGFAMSQRLESLYPDRLLVPSMGFIEHKNTDYQMYGYTVDSINQPIIQIQVFEHSGLSGGNYDGRRAYHLSEEDVRGIAQRYSQYQDDPKKVIYEVAERVTDFMYKVHQSHFVGRNETASDMHIENFRIILGVDDFEIINVGDLEAFVQFTEALTEGQIQADIASMARINDDGLVNRYQWSGITLEDLQAMYKQIEAASRMSNRHANKIRAEALELIGRVGSIGQSVDMDDVLGFKSSRKDPDYVRKVKALQESHLESMNRANQYLIDAFELTMKQKPRIQRQVFDAEFRKELASLWPWVQKFMILHGPAEFGARPLLELWTLNAGNLDVLSKKEIIEFVDKNLTQHYWATGRLTSGECDFESLDDRERHEIAIRSVSHDSWNELNYELLQVSTIMQELPAEDRWRQNVYHQFEGLSSRVTNMAVSRNTRHFTDPELRDYYEALSILKRLFNDEVWPRVKHDAFAQHELFHAYLSNVIRSTEMIDDSLSLMQNDIQHRLEKVSLHELAGEAFEMVFSKELRESYAEPDAWNDNQGNIIDINLGDLENADVTLYVDRRKILNVLRTLFMNSRHVWEERSYDGWVQRKEIFKDLHLKINVGSSLEGEPIVEIVEVSDDVGGIRTDLSLLETEDMSQPDRQKAFYLNVSRRRGDTGLGLAEVYHLIKIHSNANTQSGIRVENIITDTGDIIGAKFIITLPTQSTQSRMAIISEPQPILSRQVEGMKAISKYLKELRKFLLTNSAIGRPDRKLVRIGIGGFQGSGKTEFTRRLNRLLKQTDLNSVHVSLDFFKLSKVKRDAVTADILERGEPVRDEGPLLFDMQKIHKFFSDLDAFESSDDETGVIIIKNAYITAEESRDEKVSVSREMMLLIEGAETLRDEFLNHYDTTLLIDTPTKAAYQRSLRREKTKPNAVQLDEETFGNRFEMMTVPSHVRRQEDLISDRRVDFVVDNRNFRKPVLREVGFLGAKLDVTDENILSENEMELQADILRRNIIQVAYNLNTGHIGSAYSLAEILTALYFGGNLRYDPEDPEWSDREKLILSEGHAAPALYATLGAAGFFDINEFLTTFKQLDSRFQGHPDHLKTPGVDASTGSLGEGLSIASGVATVNDLQMKDGFTYVVMGDGDSQEGQHDEAARFVSSLGLNRIIAILNLNGLQYDGSTDDVDLSSTAEHKKLWEARGWNAIVVEDGHSIKQLNEAYREARLMSLKSGKPSIIIAKTIKGKGVQFMEGEHEWHGKVPNATEYTSALEEIESRIKKQYEILTGAAVDDIDLAISAWSSALNQKIADYHRNQTIQKEIWNKNSASNAVLLEDLWSKLISERVAGLTTSGTLSNLTEEVRYDTGESESLRAVFGQEFVKLAVQNPLTYIATTDDVVKSVALGAYRYIFGQFGLGIRGYYVPAGIRETHMASWAYGVALQGKIPVLALFESFTGIFAHQVKPIIQAHLPLKIIATHSGIGVGGDGKSHQSVVELATYHGMGVPTFEPSDPNQASQLIRKAFGDTFSDQPVFIRLTRQSLPVLNYPIGLGNASDGAQIVYQSDMDSPEVLVTIVTAGATVDESIKASKALVEKGIQARVVEINQLHFVDPIGIADTAQRVKRQSEAARGLVELLEGEVFTVHDSGESLLRGVVSSAIAMTGESDIRFNSSLGINAWGESGTADALYSKHGIDSVSIAEHIKTYSSRMSDGSGGARLASGVLKLKDAYAELKSKGLGGAGVFIAEVDRAIGIEDEARIALGDLVLEFGRDGDSENSLLVYGLVENEVVRINAKHIRRDQRGNPKEATLKLTDLKMMVDIADSKRLSGFNALDQPAVVVLHIDSLAPKDSEMQLETIERIVSEIDGFGSNISFILEGLESNAELWLKHEAVLSRIHNSASMDNQSMPYVHIAGENDSQIDLNGIKKNHRWVVLNNGSEVDQALVFAYGSIVSYVNGATQLDEKDFENPKDTQIELLYLFYKSITQYKQITLQQFVSILTDPQVAKAHSISPVAKVDIQTVLRLYALMTKQTAQSA